MIVSGLEVRRELDAARDCQGVKPYSDIPVSPMERFFADKRILVTGGAGFIGANLVTALQSYPVKELVVLDNLFTGRLENLKGSQSILRFVNGSVEDYGLVRELVGNADVVFHLAARNIIVSTTQPQEDFATNTQGTFNILEACRQVGVDKVVYASSVSIYGNVAHLPITENDLPYPLNPYAASKLCGESYCHAYFETYGVPVTIVRYSNVYGPFQSPTNPYCGVVSKFVERSMKGQALPIHGDGEQTRDFTYVEDAVDATLRAAVSPQAVGETFNIGTGTEVSINRLAELINEIVWGKDGCTHVEYVEKRDIDNVRRRVVSIEHARRVLRWFPRFTLREGLIKTVEWIKRESEAPQRRNGETRA